MIGGCEPAGHGRNREIAALRSRTGHERRTGWRAVLDPEGWRQALIVGTAGAASMAILACALAPARDTTGHEWYAAAKLTAAELLIAVGFDETAPTEYRTAEGGVKTGGDGSRQRLRPGADYNPDGSTV